MSRSKRSSWFVSGALAIVMAVLLFTGCSQSPVSSESSQPVVLGRTAASSSLALRSVAQFYVEDTISATTGGTLRLYDVVLEVPPGAVPQDELFSISIPDITKFANVFGTEGLVFDEPVTVTMSYRDADLSSVDESTIRIGYWDDASQSWEDVVCTVDFDNKLVTAKLYHFSAYGLISD